MQTTYNKRNGFGEFFFCWNRSKLFIIDFLQKYKESNTAELGSLRYTQKIIDLRISHLQNKDRGKSFVFGLT